MILRRAILFIFTLLFFSNNSFAQLQATNWRFGTTSLGLHFSPTGVVTPTTTSYIPHGNEGCSVLSDQVTGELRFYTDGMVAVDADDQLMPNGGGLIGHSSSLGSGKIAADPINCNRFYIFHNNSAYEVGGSNGLYYSLVDMTLPGNGTTANPKGDVVAGKKNILIAEDVGEGIEVVPVAKSHDFWLLIPVNASNSILVYKFTSTGSSLVTTYELKSTLVDMRPIVFCPANNKLALSSLNDYDNLLLFDFNIATGTISNEKIIPGIPKTNGQYYGTGSFAWSADGNKLYISKYRNGSGGGKLYQYDLKTNKTELVYNVSDFSIQYTARGLKMGPDGKIYFLYGGGGQPQEYIGVINNAGNSASTCNFDPMQVYMGGDMKGAGKFPDFLYLNDSIKIIPDTTITKNIPCKHSAVIDTVVELGLTALDIDNDKIMYTITSVFSATGQAVLTPTGIHYKNTAPAPYTDTVTVKFCDDYCVNKCRTFKIIIRLTNAAIPPSHLPPVRSLCAGVPLLLDAAPGLINYKWSTGETTQAITVNNSGWYKVIAYTADGCEYKDSCNVTFHPLPVVTIGKDTVVCDSIILKTNKLFPSINWSNGNTTVVNPVYTSGVYYVVVKDQNGCIGKDTILVTVGKAPIIDLGGPFYACSNMINQTLSVTPAPYILWSTGSTASTITVHAAGTYTVTVSDANGCKATDQATIIASPKPVAAFAHDDSICKPALVKFIDQSTINSGLIKKWKWDFGNGQTSTTADVMTTYANEGSYPVKLVVTSADGCMDSVTHNVTVFGYPQTDFTSVQLCSGASLQFTDLSSSVNPITKWTWDFGDGKGDLINQHPLHVYTKPGDYLITLTVGTNVNCIQRLTKKITIHPSPVPDFVPKNACVGTNAVFTDKSNQNMNTINSLTWDFGDGSPRSTTKTPIHVYTKPNSYPVKLIIQYNAGCTDSVTKKIIIHPNPTVNFEADPLKGCSPLLVNFKDVSTLASGKIVKWFWETGNGTSSTSKTPETIYKNTGSSNKLVDVKLTVTSDSGCTANLIKNNFITIYPSPKAAFSLSPKVASLSNPVISFKNNSMGADSALWNFGDQTTSDIFNTPPHQYADSGRYVVKLLVYSNYGCVDSAYQHVIIEPEYSFYVPNAFTPNGDTNNDTFSGKGLYIQDYEMLIFDRWGNLFFRTTDIGIPWDGSKNNKGDLAGQDVYIYKIQITDSNHKQHYYIGTVTLVR